MHGSAAGHTREEVTGQVEEGSESIHDYDSCVPVGKAAEKIKNWRKQGAEILYLTSRTKQDQIEAIKNVLKRHGFPGGQLLFRRRGEGCKDIAERIVPDVLIEDDCESIAGQRK